MRIPSIPERLTNQATRTFGREGTEWLQRLPEILEQCATRFNIEMGPPVNEINANFVGYARTRSGMGVILKVAVPHPDFTSEKEALQIYRGRGVNRLVDMDDELNAVVLERLAPGTMLVELPNKRERIEIACRIMKQLQSVSLPTRHGLPHFMDWMRGAFRDARSCSDLGRSRLYIDQIPKIEWIMHRLMDSSEPQILLHGDLHHFNILLDQRRGWTAIDPKGVIGAGCLDIGRFIGNIVEQEVSRTQKRAELSETLRTFSEILGEGIERVYAAAFCDKVMGDSWELVQPPGPEEEHRQEMLGIWLEVGEEINLSLM